MKYKNPVTGRLRESMSVLKQRNKTIMVSFPGLGFQAERGATAKIPYKEVAIRTRVSAIKSK